MFKIANEAFAKGVKYVQSYEKVLKSPRYLGISDVDPVAINIKVSVWP